MKRVLSYLAILFLPALLGGCLDAGGIRYSIDLEQMRGEVVYIDIVSDAEGEEGIKSDFEDLLEMTYGKEEDSDMTVTTISRVLCEEGGRLNGRTRYRFLTNDMDTILAEIGIRHTAGGYFMDVGDRNVSYVGGNGVLIEDASGKRIVWDERTKVIEVELRQDYWEKKTVSLLPYWRQWKEGDSYGCSPSNWPKPYRPRRCYRAGRWSLVPSGVSQQSKQEPHNQSLQGTTDSRP